MKTGRQATERKESILRIQNSIAVVVIVWKRISYQEKHKERLDKENYDSWNDILNIITHES